MLWHAAHTCARATRPPTAGARGCAQHTQPSRPGTRPLLARPACSAAPCPRPLAPAPLQAFAPRATLHTTALQPPRQRVHPSTVPPALAASRPAASTAIAHCSCSAVAPAAAAPAPAGTPGSRAGWRRGHSCPSCRRGSTATTRPACRARPRGRQQQPTCSLRAAGVAGAQVWRARLRAPLRRCGERVCAACWRRGLRRRRCCGQNSAAAAARAARAAASCWSRLGASSPSCRCCAEASQGPAHLSRPQACRRRPRALTRARRTRPAPLHSRRRGCRLQTPAGGRCAVRGAADARGGVTATWLCCCSVLLRPWRSRGLSAGRAAGTLARQAAVAAARGPSAAASTENAGCQGVGDLKQGSLHRASQLQAPHPHRCTQAAAERPRHCGGRPHGCCCAGRGWPRAGRLPDLPHEFLGLTLDCSPDGGHDAAMGSGSPGGGRQLVLEQSECW